MPAIPAAYLDIVDPLVNHARALLGKGEELEAIAFVGNLTPRAGPKRKRTFGKPKFRLFTEADGRFVALLPNKGHTGLPPLQ